MGCWLGLAAFVLFFISDYNDWRLSRQVLKPCFPMGAVLLAVGTVLEARRGSPLVSGWLRGLLFALGAAFLALLVYTLFFALPVEASYAHPGKNGPPAPRGCMPCAATPAFCGSRACTAACGRPRACRFGRRRCTAD